MRRNMSDRPLHSQCNYISFKRLVAKQGEKPPSKGQFFRLISVKAAYVFAYPAARRNSRCRVAAKYRAGTMSIGANPPLQISQEL